MVIIRSLSSGVSKEISDTKERLQSYVRRNDRENSKYNNQHGIKYHWTCQCITGGSCHLWGGAVAPAPGEAAIAP